MLAVHEHLVASAYEANHASLVRYLTAITRDASDAEDLAHEAFIRLATELEAGRAPDDPRAWLHKVGWNLAMSRGRHRSVVQRRTAELNLPDAPPPPDRTAIGHETRDAIVAALSQLSTVERDAVLLAAEGRAGDEVASRIGRTAGATRTLLCRARAKLRLTLDPELLAAW
jgi:RNA polymerase sigma-70 factor (ECF subfamily)